MRHPIVLVHGAWHGAWCYDRVIDLLRPRGYEVCAVDLPLQGTAGDIAEARRCIERHPGAVVLGHSYGGLVITHASAGSDVAQLVYLCALMPDQDEDLAATLAGAPPSTALQSATVIGDDGRVSIDPDLAVDAFYDDCPPADAQAAIARLRPQHFDGFPLLKRRAPWRDVPATYVICQDDRALHPQLQHEFASRADTVVEWAGAHSPFITQPDAVAAMLAERAA